MSTYLSEEPLLISLLISELHLEGEKSDLRLHIRCDEKGKKLPRCPDAQNLWETWEDIIIIDITISHIL